MTQRLSPAFGFKAADLGEQGEFRGYASTFGGPPDSYGDIIAPGAFADSLRKHAANGSMPAMLWSHDQNEPIGRWLTIQESDKGLEVTGKLTLATRRGAEAYALMREGAMSGLSIGYTIPPGGSECSASECTLKQVELHEISPVAIPANSSARITAVKSGCDCTSVPQLQKFLQDSLGVSRGRARQMAFACLRIATDHKSEADFEPEKLDEIHSVLTNLDSIFDNQRI